MTETAGRYGLSPVDEISRDRVRQPDGRWRREVDRAEFLAARPKRSHDDELHSAWGATCTWDQDGVTFEEHQPDIGRVRFFVTE